MSFKKPILTLLLMLFAVSAWAARLDTLAIRSEAMKRDIKISVIVPDKTQKGGFPTVYMLPGYSDDHLRGYVKQTNVRDLAEALGLIIVVPDPSDSWYFDSPIDPTFRYETFVTKELPAYVDSHYPTIADRSHRAISGLSMGGHGALFLAIRHQNLYCAAGSMSGGVDFRPFPDSWKIKLRLGEKSKYPDNWEQNTVMAQLPKLQNGSLQLIIDCGTEDFFFNVNVALHDELTRRGIAHEFTSRPGAHNWEYWRRSLRDHLLFFHDVFTKGAK